MCWIWGLEPGFGLLRVCTPLSLFGLAEGLWKGVGGVLEENVVLTWAS